MAIGRWASRRWLLSELAACGQGVEAWLDETGLAKNLFRTRSDVLVCVRATAAVHPLPPVPEDLRPDAIREHWRQIDSYYPIARRRERSDGSLVPGAVEMALARARWERAV